MLILLYFFYIISFSVSSVSLIYYIYSITKEDNLLIKQNEETILVSSVSKDETSLNKEPKYEEKYLEKVRELKKEKGNSEEIDLTQFYHLKNNFILEKTPIGNVAMFFDHDTETFTYYSDNSVPYRFLEVVARKYVLTYFCVDLYVDMDKELEIIEKRKEEMIKRKEEQEQEVANMKEKEKEKEKTSESKEKKNVFAQFKTYNKDGGSGRVNSVAPPKNSIPGASSSNNTYNPLLLKEKANRYVCKGRFSNFPILKKIDRKKIDKDYALSFAEYKMKFILNNCKL